MESWHNVLLIGNKYWSFYYLERGRNKLRDKNSKKRGPKNLFIVRRQKISFFFNVALNSVPIHCVWHCFVKQDDIVNADGRITPFNFFFFFFKSS